MSEMSESVEDLKWSLTASSVMHILFFLILYFGVPSFINPPPPMVHPLVPINIVDIGEITNTSIKDNSAPPPAPAPQPKPVPTPPTPAQPAPPTPPAPSKPDVPDEGLAAPKPQQKPKPPEPPKEEKKPQPPQPDQLSSVLKNVAKLKPDVQQNDSKTPSDSKEKTPSATSNQGASSNALSDRLTISEEDALRRQISLCWNMPVGAREAQNLIVEVLIDVNPDRTVRNAQIVDQLRMATDPYFRSAAESALRALRHPKCNPLMLNPDKYDQWKTIRFNFDPRDML